MEKREIIICECHSTQHQYIFLYDEDKDKDGNITDRTVYIHTHLNKQPFFKRIWIAIRYIFGYQCRYGAFDEFIIKPSDVDKFKNIVKFLEIDKDDSEEISKEMDVEALSYIDAETLKKYEDLPVYVNGEKQ